MNDTGFGGDAGERNEPTETATLMLKCIQAISHTPPDSAKGTESIHDRVSVSRPKFR